MPNQFKEPNHYDHTVVDDDGLVVGHIRIKPNRILWKPRGSRSGWYGVSLADFGDRMVKKGSKQKQ